MAPAWIQQLEGHGRRVIRTARDTIEAQSMSEIVQIKAREILDSRGNPTVEVDVTLTVAVGAGVLPSLRGRRRENTKLWSCGMAMRSVIWVKGC